MRHDRTDGSRKQEARQEPGFDDRRRESIAVGQ
jgi:hypothetical protein